MKFNKLMKIRSSAYLLPFFLLGMNNCNDQDNDGYTSAQGDCDDSNPDVNPGAQENSGDGIDNNCNGKVDELMIYATFVDRNEQPVEGIPVWLGQSADSEVIFSDENGKIEIEIDSSPVIFNYANKYEIRQHDKLGNVVSEDEHFDITSGEIKRSSANSHYVFDVFQSADIVASNEENKSIRGNINNVNTDSLKSGASTLNMATAGDEYGESIPYSIIDSDSVSYSYPHTTGSVMAYQYDINSLNRIPTGIDIVCEPTQEQDFSLENIFDQKISFDVDNISPYSTKKSYYSTISLCGDDHLLESSYTFSNAGYDVGDTSDVANSVYSVNPESFSSSSVYKNKVKMYTKGVTPDSNLSFYQDISLVSNYSTTISVAMPDLFLLNSDIDFSSNDIQGTEIEYSLGDLKNWELEWEHFSFLESYGNQNSTKSVTYSWNQYATDSNGKLAVSKLPESILEYWPSVGEDMVLDDAHSGIVLHYSDPLDENITTSAAKFIEK